jgi:CxxC motif-containing protein (DUF1111 family)
MQGSTAILVRHLTRALMLGSLVVSCAPTGGARDPNLELQGGDLTVFDATSKAYDMPAPIIADKPLLMERFRRGDQLYGTPRVTSPAKVPGTGGLGPLYTAHACETCHKNAGRTLPTLFTSGGSGYDFSTVLVFLRSRTTGEFFPDYGRVLHDQATLGAVPEGKLHVEYTEKCAAFPTADREAYCLLYPRYWITDWYTTPPPADDLLISVRQPCRHVGLGLMLAVDRNELQALASLSYPTFGISPKLQWMVERNVSEIGVSGLKAQHSDLTVELAYSSHFGVTSHRYPDEAAEGQVQDTQDFGIEIDDRDLADVDFYVHALGVPARRNVDDSEVRRGQELFQTAGCALCHAPTLHTSEIPPQLIDGTPMPMLAGQIIHPYSDFLLHDLGPELGDDFSQFQASGDEWRTAPLWGIGLQEVVNGHMHLMHDGRARNVVEAILWHAGEEGAVSTQIFRHMPKPDRDALIAFVLSL